MAQLLLSFMGCFLAGLLLWALKHVYITSIKEGCLCKICKKEDNKEICPKSKPSCSGEKSRKHYHKSNKVVERSHPAVESARCEANDRIEKELIKNYTKKEKQS